MFGAESAIRPDLAMDVADTEGLEDGAEGEDNSRGKRMIRDVQQRHCGTR